MVATGDSITAQNSDRANHIWGDSWATYAALASGGKLGLLYTCAQGGYTTANINGIFATEVAAVPLQYQALLIAGGTNDTDGVSDTYANLKSLVVQGLSRHAFVALQTIPPNGQQAIGAPTGFTATPVTGTGTLPAGTYYYQIATRGTFGSSAPSTEVSVTLSATGSISFAWNPVGGMTGYIIWGRGTGNGGKTGYCFISGPGTAQTTALNVATDTGAALTAGTMQTTDTTASNTQTTATRAKIARVNASIHRLADKYGLPVVDQYSSLVDWVNSSQYKANYSGDGTHPIPKTARLMGVNVATALAPSLPPRTPYLAGDIYDPTVITPISGGILPANATGGILSPNSGGATRPSNWTWYGGTSGASSTLVNTDANVLGWVYTISKTDWATVFSDFQTTTGWSVGDRVSFACKVKSAGLDAAEGASLNVGVKFLNASISPGYLTSMQVTRDVPSTSLPGGWAIWYGESVIPAGTAGLQIQFYLAGAGCSASLAQPTLRNLTALGLA
jgi:lysophospholipase L1-like esterase